MCKVFGYCRISRKTQNLERQARNILAAYPDAIIVKEAYTGTKIEGRKELEKLLRVIKPGDCIVFDSVSRMSRNAAEGFKLYQELFKQGVDLVFLKERYVDTRVFRDRLQQSNVSTGKSYIDEGLRTILLGIAEEQIAVAFEQAEKEVTDLHQRTAEGIETARRNGKQIGRTAGVNVITKKSIAVKEIIRKHSKDFAGTLTDSEVLKLAGCSRNSYYLYKRQLREEIEKAGG